jgi:hypothetical protein
VPEAAGVEGALPSDAMFQAIKSQLSALQYTFAQQHAGHKNLQA